MATADSTLPLEQLRLSLESPAEARSLLQGWHLRDLERGYSNLVHLSRSLPLEALRDLCFSLQRLLPRCPDPDMALNNLERFLANPRRCRAIPDLLESAAGGLEILLQLFSTSQFFSDLLTPNPGFPRHAAGAVAAQPQPGRDAGAAAGRSRTPLRGRCVGPAGLSPLSPAAQRCASAPTTSSAIGRWRRSRATCRAWPTPPWKWPWPRPCQHLARALRRADHRRRRAGPLRHPGLRQARRRGAQLQQRHRPDVPLRRGRRDARQTSAASATTSSMPASPARSSACCRRTPTVARRIASICGCGPRAIAARWPGRWPARSPTTTRSAAPGNARP